MTSSSAASATSGSDRLGSTGAVPRLEAVGVTVRFGGLVALNDISLSVPPASIIGLVGPNGAGKSTLFAVMSGLLRPTAGTVRMSGDDVTRTSPQARARRGLARTFQHPELFAGLTVREHVVLAYRVRHSRSRIWSDLWSAGGLRPGPRAERERVDQLIETLDLGPIQHRAASGLPLGNARLVEVARALAVEPSVLLLDEPSSGLDQLETEHLAKTFQSLVHDHDVSLLLVEHDVDLVMRLCHYVNVLDFGSKISEGMPEQVRSDPKVRAAYLGQKLSRDGETT